MKKISGLVIMIVCCTMASIIAPASAKSQEGSPEVSKRNAAAVFKYLLPEVYSSGKAVRLYYVSNCRAATDPRNAAVPFPFVKVRAASRSKTGLAAVREIFARDRRVAVAEGPDGIIRIWIGKVPTAILGTRLPRLSLNTLTQYNPDEVFSDIVDTKEMQIAMTSLRFSSVWNLSSTRVEPDKSYPHLPAIMKNMTAEQVLDEVAKTWAGQIVVIYGACAQPTGRHGERPFWLGWNGEIMPR
jgi:hypothetical protein